MNVVLVNNRGSAGQLGGSFGYNNLLFIYVNPLKEADNAENYADCNFGYCRNNFDSSTFAHLYPSGEGYYSTVYRGENSVCDPTVSYRDSLSFFIERRERHYDQLDTNILQPLVRLRLTFESTNVRRLLENAQADISEIWDFYEEARRLIRVYNAYIQRIHPHVLSRIQNAIASGGKYY